MSDKTVLENAFETFNLLRMCQDDGISNIMLEGLVKRHTNTIIDGGEPDTPLEVAIGLAAKYSIELDVARERIAELKVALTDVIYTANHMYGDSYLGADSMKWIKKDITNAESILNKKVIGGSDE